MGAGYAVLVAVVSVVAGGALGFAAGVDVGARSEGTTGWSALTAAAPWLRHVEPGAPRASVVHEPYWQNVTNAADACTYLSRAAYSWESSEAFVRVSRIMPEFAGSNTTVMFERYLWSLDNPDATFKVDGATNVVFEPLPDANATRSVAALFWTRVETQPYTVGNQTFERVTRHNPDVRGTPASELRFVGWSELAAC